MKFEDLPVKIQEIASQTLACLITIGKTHQLPHVIQTGQQVGMITFQQSYQHRVGEGRL